MRRTKEENKMTGIMTENEVDRWMDVGGGGSFESINPL